MRENRPYGSVGGWGLIAPRLPNRAVRLGRRTGRPSYALYALADGLEVRRTPCTPCPTDWKSVVRPARLARRTSSPSPPKIALYDSTR